MEYQKIINLLDNEATKPSKFRTKEELETNHQSHGTHNTN